MPVLFPESLHSFVTGNYIQQQVDTWTKQYRATEHVIPAMERLIEWLPLHFPESQKTTVAHGNFRYCPLGFLAVGCCPLLGVRLLEGCTTYDLQNMTVEGLTLLKMITWSPWTVTCPLLLFLASLSSNMLMT